MEWTVDEVVGIAVSRKLVLGPFVRAQQSQPTAEQDVFGGSIVRTPLRLSFAVSGILLPYCVGIAGTLYLNGQQGDHEYYLSGQLQTWDVLTGYATLAAYFLGVLACVPWARDRFSAATSRHPGLLAVGLLCAALLQLVAVLAVRFAFYYQSGGIL